MRNACPHDESICQSCLSKSVRAVRAGSSCFGWSWARLEWLPEVTIPFAGLAFANRSMWILHQVRR